MAGLGHTDLSCGQIRTALVTVVTRGGLPTLDPTAQADHPHRTHPHRGTHTGPHPYRGTTLGLYVPDSHPHRGLPVQDPNPQG